MLADLRDKNRIDVDRQEVSLCVIYSWCLQISYNYNELNYNETKVHATVQVTIYVIVKSQLVIFMVIWIL